MILNKGSYGQHPAGTSCSELTVRLSIVSNLMESFFFLMAPTVAGLNQQVPSMRDVLKCFTKLFEKQW